MALSLSNISIQFHHLPFFCVWQQLMVLIWCVLSCVFKMLFHSCPKSLHHASGWWSRCLRVQSGEGSTLLLSLQHLLAYTGVERGRRGKMIHTSFRLNSASPPRRQSHHLLVYRAPMSTGAVGQVQGPRVPSPGSQKG